MKTREKRNDRNLKGMHKNMGTKRWKIEEGIITRERGNENKGRGNENKNEKKGREE